MIFEIQLIILQLSSTTYDGRNFIARQGGASFRCTASALITYGRYILFMFRPRVASRQTLDNTTDLGRLAWALDLE